MTDAGHILNQARQLTTTIQGLEGTLSEHLMLDDLARTLASLDSKLKSLMKHVPNDGSGALARDLHDSRV